MPVALNDVANVVLVGTPIAEIPDASFASDTPPTADAILATPDKVKPPFVLKLRFAAVSLHSSC